MQVRPLLSEAVKAVLRPVNESRYVVCIKFSQIAVSPSVGQDLSEFAKAKMFRNLPEFTGIYRNKLYHSVAWSKSFEVPWNNVNVPLVVQNKDNIFTSSVIRSQKYWYFTINSLVRFAHSFVYLVKYQYFCSLIPSVVKILSLFFTTRGTLLQYLEHEAFSLPSFEVNKYYIVFHSVPNGFQKWNFTCVVAHLQKPEKKQFTSFACKYNHLSWIMKKLTKKWLLFPKFCSALWLQAAASGNSIFTSVIVHVSCFF